MKFQYSRPPTLPHLRGGLPLVDVTLHHQGNEAVAPALVDSGATISILPYDVGLKLGLKWEEQSYPIDVGGILENTAAFGVIVQGKIESLPPVILVFAWVRRSSDEIRTILGQMNFFHLFKITFEAYSDTFEITPLEV